MTSRSDLQTMALGLPAETERTFGTGYEDFYQEPNTGNELAAPEQTAPGDASIDRDNELLSFRQLAYNFTLLDHSLRRTTVSLSARLHGMFFTAEPPPTPTYTTPAAFPELTCYRRNLFQITGSITLPRSLRYMLTDHGDRIPIVGHELQISATESVEGHPVKLICVPWKTPVANVPPVPEDKGEKEPGAIPLDIMSNQDMDADFATFPLAWKRLQFRIATANNGRRRELQQHFIVRIKLVATLPTNAKVAVAEAKSNAIIVRGRSPRNFQQRKEQPVGGDKGASRRQNMQPPAALPRRTTSESVKSPLKRERTGDDNAFTPFDFNLKDATPNSTPSTTPVPATSTPTLPSSKSNTNSTSPPPLSTTLSSNVSNTPASDTSTYKRPVGQPPAKVARTQASKKGARPHPYKRPSLPALSSTKSSLPNDSSGKITSASLDSAELLYEYFPIGVEEWMDPVDPVYRPHFVHHASNLVNAGSARMNNAVPAKNNRYFSQDTTPATATVPPTATTGPS